MNQSTQVATQAAPQYPALTTPLLPAAGRQEAALALAAQGEAEIKAMATIAAMHPRTFMEVHGHLMEACKRFGFAEAALYKLPRRKFDKESGRWVWEDIPGLSIRFTEEARNALRHTRTEMMTVHEDTLTRTVRVMVWDAQANNCIGGDVVVQKTVERKKVNEGQRVVGKRLNSYGDEVFIVETTEAELQQKINALAARIERNAFLKLLSADIKEDALKQISATIADGIKKDPKGHQKAVAAAFRELGVSATELANYMGKPVEALSPQEIANLKGLYCAVRDGQTTWQDLVAQKDSAQQAPPVPTSDGGNGSAVAAPEAPDKAAEDKAEMEAADLLAAVEQAESLVALGKLAKAIAALPKRHGTKVRAAYEAKRARIEKEIEGEAE